MRTSGSKNIAQTLNSRSQEEELIWIVIKQWNIYHDNVGTRARGGALASRAAYSARAPLTARARATRNLVHLLNNNVDEKKCYFQGFDDHVKKQL